MERKIRKWSLWCFSAIASLCLVVAGIVAVPTYETSAAAANEFTVDAIKGDVDSNATSLYIIDANGDGTTWGAGDWTNVYTFEKGTGTGLSLNGIPLETTDIKQPGSFYIALGVSAELGDVFVIDGSYYSAAVDKRITFNNSALIYNGGSWETWTGTYSGEMMLSTASSGSNTQLYIQTENTLQDESSVLWRVGKGAGLEINGEMVMVNNVTIANSEICINFDTPLNVKDVVTISGVFEGSSGSAYVAHECRFIWTGEWSAYTTIDQTLTQLQVRDANSNGSGFYITLEKDLHTEDWDNAFTLVSGSGFSLNGKALPDVKIKPIHTTVYVDLGAIPAVGDLLSIQGTYYYAGSPALQIVFNSTQTLKYNGSAWVVEEKTYALGDMSLGLPSVGAGSAQNTQIYLKSNVELPINSWDGANAFSYESGIGVTLNGAATGFEMKSADGFLFISIGAVSVGDVVSVGGTFTSAANGGCRYLINRGNYTWNGSTWEVGKPYTLLTAKNVTAVGGDAACIYVAVGGDLGVSSWEDKDAFVLKSGKGISLNGNVVSNAKMKPLGNQVYIDFAGLSAKAGDIVTLEGMYESKADNASAKLVFAEPVLLQFNGSTWGSVTAQHLGVMYLAAPSKSADRANNTQLYLESNVDRPIKTWDAEGVFALEQGAGITINGVKTDILEIKSAPEGFFMIFSGAKVNDVITVSGVFKCVAQENVRYNIEESKFIWNGECWEEFGAYNSYTYTELKTTSDASASAMYLLPLEGGFPIVEGTWTEKLTFRNNSGAGVTINGTQISMEDIKFPGSLYIGLGDVTASVNDIFVIDGIFYNDTLNVKYYFDDVRFIWNGSKWVSSKIYEDADLVAYDDVTIDDLGLGAAKAISGTSADFTSLTYTTSPDNTTGSIKFRFAYNTANIKSAELAIRLRGDAWAGVHFKIAGERIALADDAHYWENYISLNGNTDYEIELGAINLLDSESVWVYIKVNGIIWFSETQQIAASFNTNNVSIYFANLEETMLKDPDYVAINYVTAEGTTTEYVKKNTECSLAANAASAFVGWEADGVLYQAGQTIALAETDLTLTAFVLDFTLEEGAAIRLASTADESGIRFTAYINEAELNKLLSYVADVQYGMLIMPNDYLNGNMPNLTDFEAGKTVLQLPGEISETVSGYIIFRGAMKKLFTQNYGRDFAGRGYMIITLHSGETITIYTPFNTKDNVRSVKTVALKFKADTAEYEKLSDAKKAVIEAYATSESYSTSTATTVAAQMEEGYAAAYVSNKKKEQTNFAM